MTNTLDKLLNDLETKADHLRLLIAVVRATAEMRDSDHGLADGCACDGFHGHPDEPGRHQTCKN